MNELSNTMDLSSTLLRAQSLFRRFQRTVDAIDKKHNFPVPNIRQRNSASSSITRSSSQKSSPTAIGTDDRNGAARKAKAKDAIVGEAQKERVISPELRGLLSRKVVVLDKTRAAVSVSGGNRN